LKQESATDAILKIYYSSAICQNDSKLGMHAGETSDFTPSKLHFSVFVKDALHGTHFEDDNSVIEAMRKWLRRQDKSWYQQGIQALVPRWRKAVQVDGDYVEK
jgi:nitrate reductase assembly molybdenum cofactor insertion protein NarJ